MDPARCERAIAEAERASAGVDDVETATWRREPEATTQELSPRDGEVFLRLYYGDPEAAWDSFTSGPTGCTSVSGSKTHVYQPTLNEEPARPGSVLIF